MNKRERVSKREEEREGVKERKKVSKREKEK